MSANARPVSAPLFKGTSTIWPPLSDRDDDSTLSGCYPPDSPFRGWNLTDTFTAAAEVTDREMAIALAENARRIRAVQDRAAWQFMGVIAAVAVLGMLFGALMATIWTRGDDDRRAAIAIEQQTASTFTDSAPVAPAESKAP